MLFVNKPPSNKYAKQTNNKQRINKNSSKQMLLMGGSKTICYNTNTNFGLMPSEMLCMRDTGPNKKCTDDKNKN